MKKIQNTYSGDNEELMRMGKTLLIVLLFFGSVYLLFAVISGEIKLVNKPKKVEINYEEVLAGSIPSIKDHEYYVLLYNFSSDDYFEILNITRNQDKKIYTVDLEKGFNTNYIANNLNEKNTSNLNSLKVINPTLIKVVDKKIVNVFEKKEEIQKELLKLVRHE